jgi:hypothetical protein
MVQKLMLDGRAAREEGNAIQRSRPELGRICPSLLPRGANLVLIRQNVDKHGQASA